MSYLPCHRPSSYLPSHHLSPPQYDLALLAPQVLGTPATDVALDAEQLPGSNPTPLTIMSPRIFWGALAIAVVVLLGLIARLLKKEPAV